MRLSGLWTYIKIMRICQKRVTFWKQVERNRIKNGIDPLNEGSVDVKKMRMAWEELLAIVSNPEDMIKEKGVATRKMDKCLEWEKTIFDTVRNLK